jgi:non-specific serine/threonine protein kinase
VAEICVRLDGLPLAIELAAAHSNILRPLHILEGLRERRLDLLAGGVQDLPVRQQTLRAAISWSYELLGTSEKVLFRQLAAFVGGCTLAAAEATCSAPDAGNGSVVDRLASLVSKNLLRLDDGAGPEPRFRMLETIRDFALEELVRSGETTRIRQCHAEFFCALAEEAEPQLLGSQQVAWLDRLEREHDNLRAALRWGIDAGDVERSLRLGGALWRLWYVRGYFTEGRSWLAELLALPGSVAPTAERAKVLNGAGNLAYNQGDYAAAQALHEESLAIRRELGDQRGIAGSLNNLGLIARYRGEHATAHALLQEAIAIERQLGVRAWEAASLNNLGNVLYDLGELTGARLLHEESLSIATASGDAWTATMAQCDLANIEWEEGHFATARALHEASLAQRRELGDQRGMALSLVGLGHVAVSQSDRVTASAAFAQSLAISRDVGDRHGVVLALEGFAALAGAQGHAERALRLLGAAVALRKAIGVPPAPASARLRGRLESARHGLGRAQAVGALTEGRLMSLDEAVRLALSPAKPDEAGFKSGTAGPRIRNGRVGGLTPRELEVAALIAQGFTNRLIAAELVISEGTAANHVERILNKLGFHSRAQIATWAIEHELHSALVWSRPPDRGRRSKLGPN